MAPRLGVVVVVVVTQVERAFLPGCEGGAGSAGAVPARSPGKRAGTASG
ncbi:hypothetical protein [Kribbella endophytica]